MRRWSWLLLPSLLTLLPSPARAGDARTVAALDEMRTLAEALETCAAFSSVYVSLESLNDVTFQTNNPAYDWINFGGGAWIIRPTVGRYDAQRRVFTDGGFLDPNAWQGPFVNFQQGRSQIGTTPYDQGSPLDPWGSPYLFYSPLGLVRGDLGAVTLEFHADGFDRYTVASLGPDAIVSGDDLFRPFGGSVSTFAISSIQGASVGISAAPAPTGKSSDETRADFSRADFTLADAAHPIFHAPLAAAITLRGINLGADPTGAQITFNNTDITAAVTDWRVVGTGFVQRVEIDLQLPFELRGTGDLVLHRGATQSNPLTLQLPEANAAEHWPLYR